MIPNFIKHLIENIPSDVKIPFEVDLVLSGGAFNGSYMLGSLYYLRELEKQNKIKINKISGSSVGSILGLLYCSDNLELFNVFYKSCHDDLIEKLNLSKLLQLKTMLKDKLPPNICSIVKDKLFISYHNIEVGIKTTKHKYKNIDELLDCVIRSCYVPFLVNYKPAYKDKYIDGMLPYFFKESQKRRVLYINIFTHDKIRNSLAIRNEHTNLHRILNGINDIHIFFIKNHNTYMCSYVDDWSFYEYFIYLILVVIERTVLISMFLVKDLLNIKSIEFIIREITRAFLIHILTL
jgi:hypothetical protein